METRKEDGEKDAEDHAQESRTELGQLLSQVSNCAFLHVHLHLSY